LDKDFSLRYPPTPTLPLKGGGRFIFILLLLFGIGGVISTYTRLSETDDELFHVKCGMEWWENGTYTVEPLHPPLARVAAAALPYWLNVDDPARRDAARESWRDTYLYKQLLSRLGILPFYIFSCLLVFAWGRELFGNVAALWSLALYVTLSTVTANAGLATTDMVYTTMLLCALLTATHWLETPRLRQGIIFGVSLGLMLGSKFSGLVQFPFAMLMIFVAQIVANYLQNKPLSPIGKAHLKTGFLYALPAMICTLAIIYRFSFAPLWDGLNMAQKLNRTGFALWLFGPLNNISVWYFFPVVFFFKTPLPLLIASIIGTLSPSLRAQRSNPDAASAAQEEPCRAHGAFTGLPRYARNDGVNDKELIQQIFPLLAAIGIMAASTTSQINLGVRHVLPLYPLLAIPGGYGLAWLWNKAQWGRLVAAAFLLWQLAGFIAAYPEHIAYFNELAGKHPERITLDSDFDWGQGMILLNDALEARNIESVYLCARKDAVWSAHTLVYANVLPCPKEPITGWIAVGRAFRLFQPDNFAWLNSYEPVQNIGKTLDLYYIAPQ